MTRINALRCNLESALDRLETAWHKGDDNAARHGSDWLVADADAVDTAYAGALMSIARLAVVDAHHAAQASRYLNAWTGEAI